MEAEGGDAAQLIGTTIAGKYKITELLGEGGMGCVYVGEQQMGTAVRKVAVKTLHKHLSTDEKIKARFARECGTVSQLHHPNTIQVFDFGTTPEGLLYIVMEFIKGKSVAAVIEKEGAMDPVRVEKILTQVCGSLQEAHEAGIVHRDLKPENVVLCDRAGQTDWVEVLDFGIAKRSSEHDPNEAKLTQQGMVLGTPPYMSPEQFTGLPIDARSDIYALGVMAYEMLTGLLPFEANTAWEWATKHMTAQPKPIEAQPNGGLLPERARATIMRALEKRPDDRPASAKEFIEAFAGGASTVPTAAPVVPSQRTPVKTEMGQPAVGAMAPMGAPPPAYGAPPAAYGPPPAAPPAYGAPAAAAYGAPPAAGPPPGRAEPPAKSNTGIILGIAGALAVVVVIVLVVALKGSSSNKTTVLAAPPPVTASAPHTAEPTAEPTATVATPPLGGGGDTPPLGGGTVTPPAGGGGTAKPKGSTAPTVKPPTPGLSESPMCTNAKKSGNAAMIKKFCGK
ncbi:MAG: protein kinase [Myxococcales bacterium]|nr:protein kinase [Myxococcales bacterium]